MQGKNPNRPSAIYLKRPVVLILGAQHSGTTFLASLIGGHPDVGILAECPTLDFVNITGKAVVGTKLLIPNQIQYNRRFRFFSEKEFKIPISRCVIRNLQCVGIGKRLPANPLSISDYGKIFGESLKIVAIRRNRTENVKSMVQRSNFSFKYASYCYDAADRVFSRLLKNKNFKLYQYERLLNEKKELLAEICDFLYLERQIDMMLAGEKYNVFWTAQNEYRQTAI